LVQTVHLDILRGGTHKQLTYKLASGTMLPLRGFKLQCVRIDMFQQAFHTQTREAPLEAMCWEQLILIGNCLLVLHGILKGFLHCSL
jgi:hypothetical protein